MPGSLPGKAQYREWNPPKQQVVVRAVGRVVRCCGANAAAGARFGGAFGLPFSSVGSFFSYLFNGGSS